MTLEATNAGFFDNNEIWAGGPGSGNYVEFGVTRNGISGFPTLHWFYARTNSGSQVGFDLTRPSSTLTPSNDTIIWQGKTGNWVFKQGSTVAAQTAGDFPMGPIVDAQLGLEMGSLHTNAQQNSVYDYGAGRVQNNVVYGDWAHPGIWAHDAPPFEPVLTYGNTWIEDDNPSVGGQLGC